MDQLDNQQRPIKDRKWRGNRRRFRWQTPFPTSPSRPRPARAGLSRLKHHIKIYQGDCLEILAAIPADCVDLIFADPPYFLSNDGITCHAGKMVSVNKGKWDKSQGPGP